MSEEKKPFSPLVFVLKALALAGLGAFLVIWLGGLSKKIGAPDVAQIREATAKAGADLAATARRAAPKREGAQQ